MNFNSFIHNVSQKELEEFVLLSQVIPIELKKSLRFGSPSPPFSLLEKMMSFGIVGLLQPFMKDVKNFSIFFIRLGFGGGITAAMWVNFAIRQVFAMFALPK